MHTKKDYLKLNTHIIYVQLVSESCDDKRRRVFKRPVQCIEPEYFKLNKKLKVIQIVEVIGQRQFLPIAL